MSNIPQQHHNSLLNKKVGSGLVFGKFMPLHEGHLHLLNFARESAHRLTILVCSLPNEPIPGEIRFQWVKNQFPDANVVHHNVEIPQDPSEHQDFWNIWKKSIERHCPEEEFDAIFGSEDYGWKMAEVMGIQYIPVDRVRNLVPISGTAMRNDPMRNWDYLPPVVRSYFAKRVAIVGPKLSGKSTLARNLGIYYNTAFVAEYKHSFLEAYFIHESARLAENQYENVPVIARGQIAAEDSLVKRANRVIISDTDISSVVFWSQNYFGQCPEWVLREAEKRTHDLYIVLEPDVPLVEDEHRSASDIEEGKKVVARWEELLKKKNAVYIKVGGTWSGRFAASIKVIDQLIKASSYQAVKFAILAVDVVLFTVGDNELKVLLIKVDRPPHFNNIPGFPGGVIDPGESAEEAADRQLKDKGGVDSNKIYLEQLATFSNPARDPRGRVVSTAFFGLTNNVELAKESRAYWYPVNKISELAYDHKEILEAALDRLRSKLYNTNSIIHLMPRDHSLAEIMNIYKIIFGKKFEERSLKKKMKDLGILKTIGQSSNRE